MINTGQITRDSSLKILKNNALSEIEISNEYKFISNKLNITEEELMNYEKMNLKSFRDYENNYWLFKLGVKTLKFFGRDVSGSEKMISLIDYGLGNINAFKSAYKKLGKKCKIVNSPDQLKNDATHIILPGIGSFDESINKLKEKNLTQS